MRVPDDGDRGGPPERVGGLLHGFLEARGLLDPLDRAGILAAWAEVVGPQIARVSEAAGFERDVLFVRVVSSAWLSELKRLERDLLNRLNARRRRGRFNRIVFSLWAGPSGAPAFKGVRGEGDG